eukprot:4704266-Pleurochrysis_carterae.AAC.2
MRGDEQPSEPAESGHCRIACTDRAMGERGQNATLDCEGRAQEATRMQSTEVARDKYIPAGWPPSARMFMQENEIKKQDRNKTLGQIRGMKTSENSGAPRQ